MSILMNVRIPGELKDNFQDVCKRNHTYMTTEIIRFMKDFITNDAKENRSVQQKQTLPKKSKLNEVNLETWGELIRHPITKTWMSKDEYFSRVK